jgi:hypothetical protein
MLARARVLLSFNCPSADLAIGAMGYDAAGDEGI